LHVVILNPGIILGPGFWSQGSGVVFNKTVGDFRLFTNGTTGYVAVNDVVKIANILMKKDCNGERFVIVSENLTFRKIQYLISDALLERKPPIFIAKWVCGIACRLDWIFNTFFFQKRQLSRDGVRALHGEDTFSNKKILEFIDYEFQGIEPAIAEIVALSNSK
jgi:dihydroflavonol-4-reductase